jgi:small subunit ribosomal protein S19e
MASIHDVDPQKLIEAIAEDLKKEKEIVPPEWAPFVKTGVHKERAPDSVDWWFTRSAAILRTVCNRGPIGTSKLRAKYGGRKNRGRKPERFKKASGNIIRKILQQLEKAGLLEQEKKNLKKGRKITSKGQSLVDKAVAKVKSNKKGGKA